MAADATRTSCRRRSRPPARAPRPASGPARCATCSASTARRPASARPPPAPADEATLEELRDEVERVCEALGRRLKILVGKPGLDGHSNGAEQIAVRARDVGMDVVYEGIRLTPSQIAASALQEGVHVVGLSILSGSHRELIPTVSRRCATRGVDVPVVVGGIIPEADVAAAEGGRRRRGLHAEGLRPHAIMRDIVALVAERNGVAASCRRERRAPSSARGCASGDLAGGARGAQPRRDRAPARERGRGAAARGLPRRPGRRGARARRRRSPGRRARASRRCWASSCARGGRAGAASRCSPSTRPRSARAASLLGDRARIAFDPADAGVFIRSTAAGERLGGLAPATRAAAQALAAAFDVVVIETVGVGQSRDRRRRGGRHRRGHRPARLGRRPAVPQGRDHGDPRRARGDEGRPRRRSPSARGATCTRRCARSASATTEVVAVSLDRAR